MLMHKKTLAVCLIITAFVLIGACKKNSPKVPTNPNVPHALTDSFYYRALYDTTWVYHGDNNKGECNSANGVCSSFLYDATFTLNDSAYPHPHDSIIRSWIGQTFIVNSDSGSHAHTFSFSYHDTLNHPVSTEFAFNRGSNLTISSVLPNGVSKYTFDTAGMSLKFYKVQGTFNANVGRYLDTSIIHIKSGVFSINLMESPHP